MVSHEFDRFLRNQLGRAQGVCADRSRKARHREADGQDTACLQEGAAVERSPVMDRHVRLPQAAAARFTAATMRLWVPQRQRLSASAARISDSLGLVFFAKSAADVMIIPLTQ